MINLDVVTGENKKEHNPNQPQISDHPYTVLIIGGSRAGKTNTLPRELIELQNSIKINGLNYSSTKKNYKFSNYSLPMVLLRHINERRLLRLSIIMMMKNKVCFTIKQKEQNVVQYQTKNESLKLNSDLPEK